jgi:murein DD-endopeptidase MepM/ murein hydrolase activator NlpD
MRAMMGAAAALIASAVGAQAQTGGYQGAAGSQASLNSCCAPVELYTAPPASAPATFAEVGAAYRAAYAETLATGRALADMVVAGDAAGLLARLASPATLQRDCPELGPRLSERAFPYPSPVRTYVAEHQAGEGTCKVEIDSAGAPGSARISALQVAPRRMLPPDPNAQYRSDVVFRLPFTGTWLVAWGGNSLPLNYHIATPNQTHAYDILVWKDGGTHSGDGTRLQDYYAYGQPALAPAAGTVVSVLDCEPDSPPQQPPRFTNPLGNHVGIKVAEGATLFMAHLQRGSVRVAVGERVAPGQQIGLVGNSGNTSEPHFHVHLQDREDMFAYDANGRIVSFNEARGLPLRFSDVLLDGVPLADPGAVEIAGGTFVTPAPER